MKLAASQIAWTPAQEREALSILRRAGFAGLEIAPTRIAGPTPYGRLAEAAVFAGAVRDEYGLAVCSLQSIWYGQAGNMFGAERDYLLDYTKGAIRFAKAVGAGNLVFGCPKNRVKPNGAKDAEAVPFFRELGACAAEHGTCLALEANPAVYGTNFMNATKDALAVAKAVGSAGCKVNFDFGTFLANGETLDALRGHVGELNHVHISEEGLAVLQKRPEHAELAALLRGEGYDGYVSIEMKAQPLSAIESTVAYVAEVFA